MGLSLLPLNIESKNPNPANRLPLLLRFFLRIRFCLVLAVLAVLAFALAVLAVLAFALAVLAIFRLFPSIIYK